MKQLGKRRQKQERMCGTKVGYKMRDDARTARYALARQTGGIYDVYQCRFCGLYHVGHAVQPRRSAQNAICSFE